MAEKYKILASGTMGESSLSPSSSAYKIQEKMLAQENSFSDHYLSFDEILALKKKKAQKIQKQPEQKKIKKVRGKDIIYTLNGTFIFVLICFIFRIHKQSMPAKILIIGSFFILFFLLIKNFKYLMKNKI